MAPARRQNYARSRSRSYNTPSHTPAPPPPPPMPNQDLMPPSSRYLHNLRVIQRHDPSITSLFDQFPHVCVYHHKGDEWKKKGCEGAMFLFEREEEPKYGFYILNRNNTGDYIQRMTPDDDVEFASAYLIYRAFGKVTSDTIGLWTMVTQDREAMSQVMMRLHSYLKRGIRYPDECRRRPDTWSTTPAPVHAQALPLPPPSLSAQNANPTSMSTLSALLAKLGDPAEPSPEPSPPSRTVSASVPPPATGIPLLDSIFASASEDVTPRDPIPQSSPGGNIFHALFANGVSATSGSESSASTSCGPTPTQHVSQLPSPSSPSRAGKPLVNGSSSVTSRRSVFPYPQPQTKARNGRETISTFKKSGIVFDGAKGKRTLAQTPGRLNGRRNSDQRLTAPEQPREDEEDGWEEETGASVSVGASDGGVGPHAPSHRNKTRKARKRDRERERRRSLKRETAQDSTGGGNGSGEESAKVAEGEVEWPLVDDRSLSMDGNEVEEAGGVGLGDGLLDALAAVSEPEMSTGQVPSGHHGNSKQAKNRDRGKDRRKRKPVEDVPSEGAGPLAPVPDGHITSESIPHHAKVRGSLLDAYGRRRRVGDGVLDEEALAKDVVTLIHTDPAFVRELHQQYLKRVQV